MMTTAEILERAQAAKLDALALTTAQKNEALAAMAEALVKEADDILKANEADVKAAQTVYSEVMLDRLALNQKRLAGMAEGLRQVAALADPVGKVLSSHTRPDKLCIQKVAVPLGVVAIIYESRPNVTADAAALCLKSGNVCILRCGKEAHATCEAIVKVMRAALKKVGVNSDLVQLVEDTSRDSANQLMTAVGYIDLLIPRGGAGLISACVQNAKVPCIQTGTGICHVFVDESAKFDMALDIIENAKTSRPSVCNAMEVCLVHEKIADAFLPMLWDRLVLKRENNHPVTLLLDDQAFAVIGERKNCLKAIEGDFDTEFLDYKMAVKIVKNVQNAVEHIAKHSTHHSEAIVTESLGNAKFFTTNVDSAAVYVNASTRFTDGGEFGLGCEMGISTQKLHARGPMGLEELTTYKYIVSGVGNVR